MKFPRNARIAKGSLEAAPWAAVMFLLVTFLLLGNLLYTPGVHIELPVASLPADDALPGTDKPTLSVAMDASGRLFYENQLMEETQLLARLTETVKAAPEKPTLIVRADRAVSYENLVRLTLLARQAGIENAVLATLPRPFDKTPARP
jgi:biopolymer transport protein ExbD